MILEIIKNNEFGNIVIKNFEVEWVKVNIKEDTLYYQDIEKTIPSWEYLSALIRYTVQ